MSEVRLINANALFGGKLSDAVKYGNKTEEQQDYSYSTLMMYEIADEVDSAPTIAPVRDSEQLTRLRAKLKEADEQIQFDDQLVKRVERERDAAVADMKNIIRNSPPHTDPCDVCTHPCGKIEIRVNWCDKFEWRGTEETR